MDTGTQEAVHKLADAIVKTHEPKLKSAENDLNELGIKQDILLSNFSAQREQLNQAIECAGVHDVVAETKFYLNKLLLLKKEISDINERVARIKKRSLQLEQHKQHEALIREHAKNRELEREKQLIARPAKRS